MSLICKKCGYKQNDPETIRVMKTRFPKTELHDIPYYCGACQNNASNDELIAMINEMEQEIKSEVSEPDGYWTEKDIERMSTIN